VLFCIQYLRVNHYCSSKLNLQGFDTILERINDYQAEKEAKASRAKEEAERKQLQECSFAPEINRQPVKAKVWPAVWFAECLAF
jgi:hypothetical protein